MGLVLACLDGKAVTVGCRLAQELATVLGMANVVHLISVLAMTVSQGQTVVSQ